MADELALYLKLTDAFGGTRFGPFEGVEINLGSDPGCDIVIPEAFGVAPVHMKVLRQEGMGLIVTPVERTAAVFVWKAGARKPQQIATPVAVNPGDDVVLAAPEGPRFTVQLDQLPEEVRKQRELAAGLGKHKPSGDAMKKEAKRQVLFRIFASGPGQLVATWWALIKSGQIFTPRYLFAAAGILGGYVIAGFQSGELGELNVEMEAKAEELEDCEEQISINDPGGEPSFAAIAANVSGASTLKVALSNDEILRGLVKERAATIFAAPDRYDWLINPSKGTRQAGWFTKFRTNLEGADDLPPDASKVLAYLAANPDVTRSGWSVVTDSRGESVCARGPLGLTWRQARSLGLEPKLDALIEGSPRGWETDEFEQDRLKLLTETARIAGIDDPDDLMGEFDVELDPVRQGLQTCLYVDGEDGRDTDRIRRAVGKLESRLKKDRTKVLPRGTDGAALPMRVAAVYAADWPGVDFTRDKTSPEMNVPKVSQATTQLESQGGPWILQQTAEVLARSITLPCIAVLSQKSTGADDAALVEVFGEPLPRPLDCIILRYTIEGL